MTFQGCHSYDDITGPTGQVYIRAHWDLTCHHSDELGPGSVNHSMDGVDPVLAACLHDAGVPQFLLTALAAEDHTREVYRRLNERLDGRPLTVQDVDLVREIVYAVVAVADTGSLARPEASSAVPTAEGMSLSSGPAFPRPWMLDTQADRIALGGPPEPHSSAVLAHLRDRMALQRLTDLVARWRSGEADAETVLGQISSTLETLRKPPPADGR